jgi:hypothetical protein
VRAVFAAGRVYLVFSMLRYKFQVEALAVQFIAPFGGGQ